MKRGGGGGVGGGGKHLGVETNHIDEKVGLTNKRTGESMVLGLGAAKCVTITCRRYEPQNEADMSDDER